MLGRAFVDDDLAHLAVVEHMLDIVVVRRQRLRAQAQLGIDLDGLGRVLLVREDAQVGIEAQPGQGQGLQAGGVVHGAAGWLHQGEVAVELHQMLAPIDQQRGAGEGAVFQRETDRAGDIFGRGRAPQRAERVPLTELLLAQQVAGERESRRHAHHAHARRQGQGQHGAGSLQGGLGQGVAQKIGVLVPELLVQQIDHGALRIHLALGGTLQQMRVQGLGQHDGRAGVAAQVLLQRGKAETGGVVVLEQRRAVDHGIHAAKVRHHARQQGAHAGLVLKIRIKMGAGARQFCASSYGIDSILLGLPEVHGHLPAASGQLQRNAAAQAPGGAGDQDGTRTGSGGHSGTMQAVTTEPTSLTTALQTHIAQAIAAHGGWIGFDRFMELALYTPGLGYYAGDLPKFGTLPDSGSDFVTAPEMTLLFGQTLAVQVAEALQRTATCEVWEFGAGSGALALQLLDALGDAVQRYTIVDLSGSLRARHGGAQGGVWHERGVVVQNGSFAWEDRPTDLRPPVEIEGPQDYLTEIHPQAEAFIHTP